ncbi:hypothetical protein DYB36_001221 [Aphanomyces astaci]|uniref:SSD domain-containing protein n=1 Tax=Aphanomyces astaci TaxID=112090 RepID=A0A397A415_APHAT|nr:hypothetical protein DYB36_001221 [Aphanomyces astaci]
MWLLRCSPFMGLGLLALSVDATSYVRVDDEVRVERAAIASVLEATTTTSSTAQSLPAFTAGQQSQAIALSRNVMTSLQKLRGGTPAFYQKLYAALQVYYCDHLNSQHPHMPLDELNAVWPVQAAHSAPVPPYIRLVHNGHPNALKDPATGACIPSLYPSPRVAAQYANGYCEVMANCYWNGTKLRHRNLFITTIPQYDNPIDIVRNATTDRSPTYSILQATAPTDTLPSLVLAKATLMDWAKSVSICVAPAIVLGVLCLLTTLLFLCCRCCCNKCGGRSASPRGYSCMQKTVPVVVFAIFGGIIIGLTLCALLYNNVIVDSIDRLFDDVLGLVQDIVAWIHSAETPLVHVRDSVEGSVSAISSQLVSSSFIENGLHGIVAQLQQYVILTWQEQTVARRGAILALFAVAIAILVLGTVGIVLGLTPLRCLAIGLHVAYILGFVALVFLFVVSALFLAFSVLLGDACQLSSIVASDWSPVLGASNGVALNACFHDKSLLEALQLQDALSFADAIEIPTIDLSSMLTFDSLDQFAQAILSADPTTFDVGVDASQLVQVLNLYTNGNSLAANFPTLSRDCNPHDGQYSIETMGIPWEANGEGATNDGMSPASYIAARYAPYRRACAATVVTTCARNTPCSYDQFVTELFTNTSTVLTISSDAVAFVSTMHGSMQQLQNYTRTFKVSVNNVTGLVASLDAVGHTLQTSLVADVTAFKASMNCSFVATTYGSDLTPAMLMVALCLVLSGICMIPVNISLILLVKRLRAGARLSSDVSPSNKQDCEVLKFPQGDRQS